MAWGGPERLGGKILSPSAVSWAPKRLDVFGINEESSQLTAVRSKSEQFQLLIVSDIARFVRNCENRRLDRHFLKSCDRKDL